MTQPRWKCPKCGSLKVQVSYPTWYRETDSGTELVKIDDEADVLWWNCEECEESGNHEPDRNN